MPGDPPAAVVRTAEQGTGQATGQQTGQAIEQPAASSPLTAVSWPVRTARLQLRAATAGDAEVTWPYWRLEVVNNWLTRAPDTYEEYRAVFEYPVRLAKTLVVELDGVVIGDLMIAVEDAWAQAEVADQARGVQAELGWTFHPGYTGQGYATEAVRELIRICFTDLGLRRVTANCFAGNEASWRLMERVGMRRELYTVRESLHRSGAWLDGIGYALLADEWRGVSSTEPDGGTPGQPAPS
ncbi:GNAT family N-acetyltransferase [Jatrophihabitans sp.]|uniref:GNAT family N-acetyltransferase n=1 Tax=Jatrophihabitans sp. TaxID=1932789 RepID=UPI002EF27B35